MTENFHYQNPQEVDPSSMKENRLLEMGFFGRIIDNITGKTFHEKSDNFEKNLDKMMKHPNIVIPDTRNKMRTEGFLSEKKRPKRSEKKGTKPFLDLSTSFLVPPPKKNNDKQNK